MTIPGPLLAQMRDTVSVRVATGENAYGEESLADAVLVQARVTYQKRVTSTAKGDEVRTNIVIYMPDIDGFADQSEITLPDGTVRVVKSFTRPAWPNGTRHLEVLV